MGRRDLRHRRRHHPQARAPPCRASARSSPSRIRCSAPSMASSRCGWAWCWRQRSARSACRAAVTPIRSARSAITAAASMRCRARRSGKAATASRDFIPVARIADMLLNPGEHLSLQWRDAHLSGHPSGLLGRRQSLPSPPGSQPPAQGLRASSTRLVVHELAWTATARHADIVLPCDHDARARRHRLFHQRSPDGRDAPDRRAVRRRARRFRHLRRSRRAPGRRARPSPRGARRANGWRISTSRPAPRSPAQGLEAPSFEEFWQRGSLTVPQHPDDGGRLRRFRDDPIAHPLPTPSGKHRDLLAEDRGPWRCRLSGPSGLAARRPMCPMRGAPFFLIANQPATRLHSQLDFGGHSLDAKHRGREVARMNPRDAEPARHRRRRHHPPLQRSRRLPRRRARHRRHRARRRPAADRRLVRPDGPRGRERRSAFTAIRTC